MRPLRATLTLVLALAAAAAGCASDSAGVDLRSLELGTLEGVVTDAALRPLEGAAIVVDGTNQTATTDASGAFALQIEPGEHLVLASLPGYKGAALRALGEAGRTARLDFVLAPIPTQAPEVRAAEAHGLLSCNVAIYAGEQEEHRDCGGNDPNAKASVAFPVGDTAGLGGAVVEVVWEPTTQLSSKLSVEVWSGEGEEADFLGFVDAGSPVNLPIPQRVLAAGLDASKGIRVVVAATGATTDEEAGVNAGAALQQPFTVYLSLFYHTEPPAGYSVLSA